MYPVNPMLKTFHDHCFILFEDQRLWQVQSHWKGRKITIQKQSPPPLSPINQLLWERIVWKLGSKGFGFRAELLLHQTSLYCQRPSFYWLAGKLNSGEKEARSSEGSKSFVLIYQGLSGWHLTVVELSMCNLRSLYKALQGNVTLNIMPLREIPPFLNRLNWIKASLTSH